MYAAKVTTDDDVAPKEAAVLALADSFEGAPFEGFLQEFFALMDEFAYVRAG